MHRYKLINNLWDNYDVNAGKNGSRKMLLRAFCRGVHQAILPGFEQFSRLLPDVLMWEYFWHSVLMSSWKEKNTVLKICAF